MKPFTLIALLLVALIVYLFVSAPAPLAVDAAASGRMLSIEEVLRICAAENAQVRRLYTQEIVGAGQAVGLAFDEDWKQPAVQAGPLPALFLRSAAVSLEKNPVRLGLFLGSDFPISQSNLFQGEQLAEFEGIRADQDPRFFVTPDTGLQTAMFADLAVAEPCVTCHNEHPDSPKTDWRLGDVMGATTWTFPSDQVPYDEMFDILAALRKSFRDAYAGYLEETETFDRRPEIGERWPRDGYFLPSVEVFMAEVERRTATESLSRLLAAAEGGFQNKGNAAIEPAG
ncbi:MAG: DUF3365 domain-containing protein [Acidobacteriota bacterium]